MEEYVRWFAKLERFYRIALTLAFLVGVMAVATGVGTGNGVFFVLGFLWILGGAALVRLAAGRDGE